MFGAARNRTSARRRRTVRSAIGALAAIGVGLWALGWASVEADDPSTSTTNVSTTNVSGNKGASVKITTADVAGAKADEATGDGERSTKSGRRNGATPTFTPEREAAALTFVEAQHAELIPLLANLKINRPNEYQKVIRKLFADSERLAHSRESHPVRYELELQDWKLDSRIQLLLAKLAMSPTAQLERELLASLEEQLQVRRDLTALERDKIAQRLATVDQELREFDERRPELIDELYHKALKSAGQRKSIANAENAKNGSGKNDDGKKDGKNDGDSKSPDKKGSPTPKSP